MVQHIPRHPKKNNSPPHSPMMRCTTGRSGSLMGVSFSLKVVGFLRIRLPPEETEPSAVAGPLADGPADAEDDVEVDVESSRRVATGNAAGACSVEAASAETKRERAASMVEMGVRRGIFAATLYSVVL
mmetsp:Transcript_14398/g.31807  ORF Transcript_14398/g.31807 Transcript_14398/m.31807 type:complete len:129 (-) Transcript_14398:18-404(-)